MRIGWRLGLVFLVAVTMWGQAVITLPGGQVSLGVALNGELGAGALPANANVPGNAGNLAGEVYGIYLASQNADGITPGCFCEGWGASANGVVGYSANSNASPSEVNVTNVSLTSTPTTATTVTKLTSVPTFQITQAFAPAAGAPTALFQNTVTLTNTGSTTLTDVRYARAMDWDINPTEFNEIVTIQGLPASALSYSGNDGFCIPNPITPWEQYSTSPCQSISTPDGQVTTNANFVKAGPADQGSFFAFKFGNLAPGASTSFIIYYGAASNETGAMAALTGVKAGLYALGYSNIGGVANVNSGVWIFAFNGVGGSAPTGGGGSAGVPALSQWGLILLALLMMAAAARLFRGASVRR
jgi:type IV pilus assembly protein PilY1